MGEAIFEEVWPVLVLAVPLALLVLALRRLWRIHGHVPAARLGRPRERAPREYVEALFDGYADDYDEHLLVDLKYAGANLVSAEVNAHLAAHPVPLGQALDLGCGTGVLGVLLRPRVSHLAGVDLSGEMLHAAEQRGVYDELHRGDLLDFLRCDGRTWGLITAADVLVYLGDLSGLLIQVALRLAPGGAFIATTENPVAGAGDAGIGFTLLESGRFSHAQGYVAAVASRVGLRVVAQTPCVLRMQRGEPVYGHLHRLARRR